MDKAAFDKLVKDAVDAELAKHEEKQKVLDLSFGWMVVFVSFV